jgi:hypothetical protein
VYGLDSFGSGQGSVAGSCEYGSELSGSIKGRELLDSLRTVSFSGRTLLHGVCRKIYHDEESRCVERH